MQHEVFFFGHCVQAVARVDVGPGHVLAVEAFQLGNGTIDGSLLVRCLGVNFVFVVSDLQVVLQVETES